MINTKYQGSSTCGFIQKVSYYFSNLFSLCDLDMQWPGTIIEEGHTGIIQVKFGQNPVSNIGDVL